MITKLFTLIRNDQATRTQVYCDTTYHITVVLPEHPHSGVPATVGFAACNCDEKKSVPSEALPPSDVAVTHPDKRQDDDVYHVPEATGDPELDNASLEGSEPTPVMITSEDVQAPATHDEFEKLGQ